ncbi:MAG: TRAM domain-containing protein [Myxococcota bacterium]
MRPRQFGVIELTIDGLGAAGDGVGRLPDGRVVFVPRAIPGDRVRVRLSGVHKRVQYAEIVAVLERSADRVESHCAVDACGGCALKVVSTLGQAELKRQRVVDNLRRIGGVDVVDLMKPPLQIGDGWRYRHRVRLHAAWLNGGWEVGFFARRSHKLVPISACPVLWPELEEATLRIVRAVRALPHHARLDTIEVAYSRRDARAVAKLHGDGPMTAFRDSLDWLDEAGLSGVDVESAGSRWRHGNLELRYDHGRADEFDVRFDPSVFTQAFPAMNDELVAAVVAAVRPQQQPRLLELHAGVGNFSLPLARAGARVTVVEHNRRASILCGRNARAVGLDIEVCNETDAEALVRIAKADAVLIDPPRSGARAVAKALATGGPDRLVYVSCDSATLGRDTGILVEGGYTITSAKAFDMFPETPHVETITVFERI